MIVFECPACRAKLQVADQHAGKTIQCPTCKGKATSPANAGADAIAPAASPLPPAESPTAVTTPEVAQAAQERRREESDPGDDAPRPRRHDDRAPVKAAGAGMGAGAIIMIILGVGGCCGLGVVAILVALLVPAVQKVREAAARTQSINNLKQIGLSALSFHDANKRLPFNGSDGMPGQPGQENYSKAARANNPTSGSWAFQILPYIDQQPLWNNPNLGKQTGIAAYLCPGRGRPQFESGGGPWSDYFYNNYLNAQAGGVGPDEPNRPDIRDNKLTLVGIHDGSSNTVFAGHGNINTTQYKSTANVTLSTNIFQGGTLGTMRAGNPGMTNPGGMTLQRDSPNNPGLGSWGGPFPQGGLVVFCDCTVRMVPFSTQQFGAFLTPRGGDLVMQPDF